MDSIPISQEEAWLYLCPFSHSWCCSNCYHTLTSPLTIVGNIPRAGMITYSIEMVLNKSCPLTLFTSVAAIRSVKYLNSVPIVPPRPASVLNEMFDSYIIHLMNGIWIMYTEYRLILGVLI